MNEDFADLDFESGIAAFSFIDRKAEIRLNLGLVSKPPKHIDAIASQFNYIMIGIEGAGMLKDRLDQICNTMKTDCKNHSVNVLIAKGNRPFSSSWYILGDIERFLYLVESDMIKAPFTEVVHEQIWRAHRMLVETGKRRQ